MPALFSLLQGERGKRHGNEGNTKKDDAPRIYEEEKKEEVPQREWRRSRVDSRSTRNSRSRWRKTFKMARELKWD